MIRAWPLDPTFITPVDGRRCVGGALRVSPRVDQVMRRVEGEVFLLRRRACGKQSADGVVAVLGLALAGVVQGGQLVALPS